MSNKCVSCIKNGSTGECYDIKDKVARQKIEAIENDVKAITGVDGGHLATDEDITRLEGQISELGDNLGNIGAVEGQITEITNSLNGVIDTLNSSHMIAVETITSGNYQTVIERLNALDGKVLKLALHCKKSVTITSFEFKLPNPTSGKSSTISIFNSGNIYTFWHLHKVSSNEHMFLSSGNYLNGLYYVRFTTSQLRVYNQGIIGATSDGAPVMTLTGGQGNLGDSGLFNVFEKIEIYHYV